MTHLRAGRIGGTAAEPSDGRGRSGGVDGDVPAEGFEAGDEAGGLAVEIGVAAERTWRR
jgi:hypothetical protein